MEKNSIPRNAGFEDIFDTLITRITKIEHFKHHTGCSFSNETFQTTPYYYGKCQCDYGKKYEKFIHKKDCFSVELELLNTAFKNHEKYKNNNLLKAVRANEERRLCTAHKIDYKEECLSEVCNCGAFEEFVKLGCTHESGCPKIIPNFYYRDDDIKIYWYKTYFRNSYSNKPITLNEFKGIVGKCIRSV
jgi:hypothetical protein